MTKDDILDLMRAEVERLSSSETAREIEDSNLIEGFVRGIELLEHGGDSKNDMHRVVDQIMSESAEPPTDYASAQYNRGLLRAGRLVHVQLGAHAHTIVWAEGGPLGDSDPL